MIAIMELSSHKYNRGRRLQLLPLTIDVIGREIEKDLIVEMRGDAHVLPSNDEEVTRMKHDIQGNLIVARGTQASLASTEKDRARDQKSARIEAESMNMMKAEAPNDIKRN